MEPIRNDVPPASPPPPAVAHELRSVGGYRLLRLLGEGGMGAVYLGYQEGQQGQVAVKVLADHLAQKHHHVERFYREGAMGALLNHPNVVRTLDTGHDPIANKHFLVLEFVDGPSAQALLDRLGRLPI